MSHALAYISAGKNGVSEPEIEDFISLDDKVNVAKGSMTRKRHLTGIEIGIGRHLPIPLAPYEEDPTTSLDASSKRSPGVPC